MTGLDAELISTGSELLNGRTLNRHGQALGGILQSLGISLVRDTTLPDDPDALSRAIQDALARSPLLFVSGGLGPTTDDLTREAVSSALGRKLLVNEQVLAELTETYRRAGRDFSEDRRKQSLILEGAEVLMNPVGNAPGQRIEMGDRTIFLLPGPPKEFLGILHTHILPWLQQHIGGSYPFYEKVFMFAGIGEGDLQARIDAAEAVPAGLDVGYCAAPGRVELRLNCRQRPELLDEAGERLRKVFPIEIFAEGRGAMEQVLGDLLLQDGKTLAVAESCTGGLLGERITAVPGSSAYFDGGVVAYQNEVKEQVLGVDAQLLEAQGAVSSEVAEAMASGVRDLLKSSIGMGITGIAGPDGGTDEKPVGLVYIGLADENGTQSLKCQFSADRWAVRERSIQRAMNFLRIHLIEGTR